MAIEAALTIDETNPDTWLLIATALEERNDLQGAVAVYEQLISKPVTGAIQISIGVSPLWTWEVRGRPKIFCLSCRY